MWELWNTLLPLNELTGVLSVCATYRDVPLSGSAQSCALKDVGHAVYTLAYGE